MKQPLSNQPPHSASNGKAVAKRIDPRTVRTRKALIDAGLKLFADQPVVAVTIDDIVQAAGVGKGSFYNHFADRDSLAIAVSEEIQLIIEEAVFRNNDYVVDAAERVIRGACTYVRFFADEPERGSFLIRVHFGLDSLASPITDGLRNDIALGIAQGRFTIPSVEAASLLVHGAVQTLLVRQLELPAPASLQMLTQDLCSLLLRGLGIAPIEAGNLAARTSHAIVGNGQ